MDAARKASETVSAESARGRDRENRNIVGTFYRYRRTSGVPAFSAGGVDNRPGSAPSLPLDHGPRSTRIFTIQPGTLAWVREAPGFLLLTIFCEPAGAPFG